MTRPEDFDLMTVPDLITRRSALSTRDVMSRAIRKLTAEGSHDPAVHGPADAPDVTPLTGAERLELLAIEEALSRIFARARQVEVHYARESGLSWAAIAAAVGAETETVRTAYADWVTGQAWLWDLITGRGETTRLGLNPAERAAARQLADPDPTTNVEVSR